MTTRPTTDAERGELDFARMRDAITRVVSDTYWPDFIDRTPRDMRPSGELLELTQRLVDAEARDTLDDAIMLERARRALARELLVFAFPALAEHAALMSFDRDAERTDSALEQRIEQLERLYVTHTLDEDKALLTLAQTALVVSNRERQTNPPPLPVICAEWRFALNACTVALMRDALDAVTSPDDVGDAVGNNVRAWYEASAHVSAYTFIDALTYVVRFPIGVYTASTTRVWPLTLCAELARQQWLTHDELDFADMSFPADTLFDELKPFADKLRGELVERCVIALRRVFDLSARHDTRHDTRAL